MSDARVTCLIEGCRRTKRAEPGVEWICATHWRRYCPPRSRRRRVYLAFHRTAKREGWSGNLKVRYFRFWDLLVGSARARERAGSVDMTTITKLVGWE